MASKSTVIVIPEISKSIVPKSASMDAKIKLIKKNDRNPPASPEEAQASADPKEWSTAVKSWVKEFQKGQRDASSEAFDSLFSDSTP